MLCELLLLTCGFIASPPVHFQDDALDPMKLQGEWRVVAYRQDGQDVERFNNMRWLFDGGKTEFLSDTGDSISKGEIDARPGEGSRIELDLKGRLGDREQISFGIAKWEAETLVICYKISGERPKEFSAEEGSRTSLIRLEPYKEK